MQPAPGVVRIRCTTCGKGLAERDGALAYIRHAGRELVAHLLLMVCPACGATWEAEPPADLQEEARAVLARGQLRTAASAADRARRLAT